MYVKGVVKKIVKEAVKKGVKKDVKKGVKRREKERTDGLHESYDAFTRGGKRGVPLLVSI